ncbi:response regulator transcription factor [Saccharopolyspora sp. K220]|uniref:response regulator n=1 Tax=Saccharopolyspora soli TaxID=2926618 RepID=UPI001F582B3F|nr:response regulator transcription factor [Saccharopolyspora soli]MCI2418180.1 response regulator transcription factor [Saccharopolyspora soli]
MIRVVVADDEALIRAGIQAVLGNDDDIEVVGDAADGRQAVELVLRHRPQVAVLDIQMPELDGIATTAEVLRLAPATAVVILTTFGDDEYIAGALAAGATGFVLKAGDPRELLQAVRAVTDGAAFLSPRIAHRVIKKLTATDQPRHRRAAEQIAELSDRDRDVLALLGRGLPNAAIAAELNLTEGTVKVYVSSLLAKLGVENRVRAAILAYEAGLVEQG